MPSLIEQIDAYVGGATDSFREVAKVPAADLSPSHRRFILRNFFSAHPDEMIGVLPRYRDLLQKRDEIITSTGEGEAWRSFNDQEYRDVKVLFRLSWFGFAARKDFPEIQELCRKGRDYTDGDNLAIDQIETQILGRIVPLYREQWQKQNLEVSTTPFYHPILPLLIDNQSAREAMPEASLPAAYGNDSDARTQIQKALEFMEGHLGRRPEGMWPAEGSVSQRTAEIIAESGIVWIATDEANLHQSERNGGHGPDITGPWLAGGAGNTLRIVFRNREISDRIGFRYGRMPADQAVNDLLNAARDASARSPRANPVVYIILDGENPWETYPEAGQRFLETLNRQLELADDLELVTVNESLGLINESTPSIGRLRAGSWVNGRFSIWIGGPQKNAAWEALNATRKIFWEDARRSQNPRALESLLAAEGSDWFWWMDGQFATDHRSSFHDLFYAHLVAVWSAMEVKPDQELLERFRYIDSRTTGAMVPYSRIEGQLDGLETSYFEWALASRFEWDEIRDGGTMAPGKELIETVYTGFASDGSLLFRCDGPANAPDEIELIFIDGGASPNVKLCMLSPGYMSNDVVGWESQAVFQRVIEGRVTCKETFFPVDGIFQFRIRLRYGAAWTETRPLRLRAPVGIHRLSGWSAV